MERRLKVGEKTQGQRRHNWIGEVQLDGEKTQGWRKDSRLERRLNIGEKTHVWRVDSKMERRLKKKLYSILEIRKTQDLREDSRIEKGGSRMERRFKDRED